MRRFISVLLFLTASCSYAGEVKHISLPNGQPAELKQLKEEKGKLTVYEMTFTDRVRHEKLTVPAYRFGDYYFLQAFELKDGRLVPVVKVKAEKIPIDVSFLESIEKKMRQAGINNVAGKRGAPHLYVIFDAYCPFCIRGIKKEYPELSRKYEVHFIPFAVHGERSVKALSCILERWKRERPDKVLREVFGRFKGDWQEYGEQFNSCRQEFSPLVREITSTLVKNGIAATPTFIYQKGDRFYLSIGKPPEGGQDDQNRARVSSSRKVWPH